MKERHLGILVSLAVHTTLAALVFGLSSGLHAEAVKVVAIDFALVDAEAGAPGIRPPLPRVRPEVKAPSRPEMKALPNSERQVTRHLEPQAPAPETDVVAADDNGREVIQGVADVVGEQAAPEDVLSEPHTGMSREDAFSGAGGMLPGGKDYAYIRDEVMKNISYPVRARRLGQEGRAVVSFMVMENGSTSSVKVVKSSGYRILDDNARQAIARTVISKKVPYRVVVLLPVVYALHAPEVMGNDS